jgi:hypothetical protein
MAVDGMGSVIMWGISWILETRVARMNRRPNIVNGGFSTFSRDFRMTIRGLVGVAEWRLFGRFGRFDRRLVGMFIWMVRRFSGGFFFTVVRVLVRRFFCMLVSMVV